MKTLILISMLFLFLSGCGGGFYYSHSTPAGYYGSGGSHGCQGSNCGYQPYYCSPYYYKCQKNNNH